MPSSSSSPAVVKAELLRSPIPTPHWGPQSGSAFTVRAVAIVNAAPSILLRTLVDTSKYPEWNRFVPRVTFSDTADARPSNLGGELREGVLFVEHVDMYGQGKPSGLVKMKLLVTTLKETEDKEGKKYSVVWLGKGYPDWALRSERVHQIFRNDDGTTTYNVFETFSGPLALFVRLFVGTALVKRFKQWNDEMGRYAEETSRDRDAPADRY